MTGLTLNDCPALVLNADYRPLDVFPYLSTWNWQEAVHAVHLGKVSVVAEYDRVIRSARNEIRLPSVVALKEYVWRKRSAPFNRRNVLIRDRHICQYCSERFTSQELTYEHVLPRSRGGATSWLNISMACVPCNQRKGNRTPEEAGMKLIRQPFEPSLDQLARWEGKVRRGHIHETWQDWVYWEAELEA
jgi:5-methylcytosine-specific restriction endonuclease McrA